MEHDTSASVGREQRFECQGPADIRVELDGGQLDITLEHGADGTDGVSVQRSGPTPLARRKAM